MPARTIAIGDIHGCLVALETLLDAVAPEPDDVVITLGDYIDRGPDSRGVIDRLIQLGDECRVISLLGNHEEMLLKGLDAPGLLRVWLELGGQETVESYGGWDDLVPERHRAFLDCCRTLYESGTHIFVHANYLPDRPMVGLSREILLWTFLDPATARPHVSGKTVVVGHTSQPSGEILDLGFVTCIDTDCVNGGWLTALEVTTGRGWQTNEAGTLRGRRE